MKAINIRIPEELASKVEKELVRFQEDNPGMKLTKSDVVRHALEIYFRGKGGE